MKHIRGVDTIRKQAAIPDIDGIVKDRRHVVSDWQRYN
jgi:hypothetical protein